MDDPKENALCMSFVTMSASSTVLFLVTASGKGGGTYSDRCVVRDIYGGQEVELALSITDET